MNSLRPVVVVKLGGSLLDWPELPDRLASFLQGRREDRLVLVVGGGEAADWIRALDRIHALGEDRSHALALRALDLTAHILAALVPSLERTETFDRLNAVWSSGRVPLVPPRPFLDTEDQSCSDPLPHAWDVTTDSIAARLADRLDASELILLKSTSLPSGMNRAQAARLGLVDPFFPEAARSLPKVTYWNLRNASAEPIPLP